MKFHQKAKSSLASLQSNKKSSLVFCYFEVTPIKDDFLLLLTFYWRQFKVSKRHLKMTFLLL